MSETTEPQKPVKGLVYVADPMCSWCYGFAPTIRKIEHDFADRAPIEVLVGGLRPWTQEPWKAEQREMIKEHWGHVNEASGQPFNYNRFDDPDFIYDTEPACRAVACMRALNVEQTLGYLDRVHQAFYAEGKDTKDPEVLADIATEFDVDRQAFLDRFNSEVAINDVTRHFQLTRQWGINGYPALLVRDDDQLGILTLGYQGYDQLAPIIQAWLDGRMTTEGRA